MRAEVLIGADGIRSAVRSMVAGEQAPNEYGYVFWLATVRFPHPRMVPGYTGHYWGRGQRFGLIDIGGGMALLVGNEEHARRHRRVTGTETRRTSSSAFDGWAPEVVEAIERTPADAIISVPASGSAIPQAVGQRSDHAAGRRRAPDADQLGHKARAPRWRTVTCWRKRSRACPIAVDALRAYEDRRRDRARMLVRSSRRLNRLEQAQNPVACAARNLGVRCAPMRIADPAHDPSDAIRPGVDSVTQTEVRRLLSPVERWYWIADQVSPLNVIARVRLGGHIRAG